MKRAAISMFLFASACSGSSESDAGGAADAGIPAPDATGFADAEIKDAVPPLDCVASTSPLHLVEDFCRTADGELNYNELCFVEEESHQF